jgi:hypothetical protein
MSTRNVVIALVLGALAALLLWRGSTEVALLAETVAGFVMRALGKDEQARRLQLLPNVRLALDGLRLELEEVHHIKTYVGSTLRTPKEQAAAVAASASDTQQSWHLLARAVDMYVIDPDTGLPDRAGKRTDLYLQMHRSAVGWGFRGIAFDLATGAKKYLKSGKWDGGHLEFPEGMTWAQAAAVGGAIG